jgi:c-di-GMP-binding flagellar brake protein YcgR
VVVGVEKRRFLRLDVLLEIVHSHEKLSSTATLSLTKNISRGGVCIVDFAQLGKFKVSEFTSLNIFFPYDKLPVKAKGKIVWIKEHEVGVDAKGRLELGIEFIDIGEADKERIEAYIKERLGNRK